MVDYLNCIKVLIIWSLSLSLTHTHTPTCARIDKVTLKWINLHKHSPSSCYLPFTLHNCKSMCACYRVCFRLHVLECMHRLTHIHTEIPTRPAHVALLQARSSTVTLCLITSHPVLLHDHMFVALLSQLIEKHFTSRCVCLSVEECSQTDQTCYCRGSATVYQMYVCVEHSSLTTLTMLIPSCPDMMPAEP